MQDKAIIDKIEKLLDWYSNFGGNTTIENLLDFQDKLSLLSVNLAHITALSKGSYLRTYFQRKFTFSTKKIDWIKKGSSAAKADEQARLLIGDIKEVEIQEEEYSDLLTLKLRQINRVLQAVQQRISYQKNEKDIMLKMSHDNKKI
jgi:hypothetical protein